MISVITNHCMPKFGAEGFEALKLHAEWDGYPSGRMRKELQTGNVLLMWHGNVIEDGLISSLRINPGLHILLLGENLVDGGMQIAEFSGRIWGFKLPNRQWLQQAQWRRRALQRFCESVRAAAVSSPDWSLLRPPVAPEHVIACYLCAIAGLDPDPAWAAPFGEEVSYWATEHNAQTVLEWSRDSVRKESLSRFLHDVGDLEISEEIT